VQLGLVGLGRVGGAIAALRQQLGVHAVKKAAGPSGAPGETAGPSTG
jgi:6-phosphogluconate dehydrogenase